jgi:hypothetical protein
MNVAALSEHKGHQGHRGNDLYGFTFVSLVSSVVIPRCEIELCARAS